MTTQEQRELDAWIAEHVMGWRIYTEGRLDICAIEAENTDRERTYCVIANHPWSESDFEPTTDPAASREVERKCLELLESKYQSSAVVYKVYGQYHIDCQGHEAFEHDNSVIEPTLELAWAKLSKKLFS